MLKIRLIIVLLLIGVSAKAQIFYTQALSPDIYTIQLLKANGDWNSLPVIKFDNNDYINISFDRISDDSFNRLRYKIIACNADWTVNKDLSEVEYLNGFNDNAIDNYHSSINTTVNYTHFSVDLPNDDISFKLSGNYVVLVYEEDNYNNILLSARISVLDSNIDIAAEVSSITDIDANKNHQQVAFSLKPRFRLQDPLTDLKVYVRQNNRNDNERTGFKPTIITPDKIGYGHIKDLIFEAGNEFRRFDISSNKYNGFNVNRIEYRRPYYYTDISTDEIRSNKPYVYDQDQNGHFIIRNRDAGDNDIEADYFQTTFTLAVDEPISQNIYLNGFLTQNIPNEKYKMTYDAYSRTYNLTLLLKQGLYNYQYLTKDGNQYSERLIEGNFYQTENEYSIWVYYRPIGQRFDRLVGVTSIISRQK